MRLSSIHDKQGSMDHTAKINPYQSVSALIPLDRPKIIDPL